jgi:hypothetical protein
MKTILKHLGISALLVCMFTLVKAQNGQMPSADVRASKMTEWMKTNLNLTADQATKVQELNMRYAVKTDSLRSGSQSKDDKRAAMKSDGAARDAELKGILTDEQYKTYQEKKKEMKHNFKNKSMENSQSATQ